MSTSISLEADCDAFHTGLKHIYIHNTELFATMTTYLIKNKVIYIDHCTKNASLWSNSEVLLELHTFLKKQKEQKNLKKCEGC